MPNIPRDDHIAFTLQRANTHYEAALTEIDNENWEPAVNHLYRAMFYLVLTNTTWLEIINAKGHAVKWLTELPFYRENRAAENLNTFFNSTFNFKDSDMFVPDEIIDKSLTMFVLEQVSSLIHELKGKLELS